MPEAELIRKTKPSSDSPHKDPRIELIFGNVCIPNIPHRIMPAPQQTSGA